MLVLCTKYTKIKSIRKNLDLQYIITKPHRVSYIVALPIERRIPGRSFLLFGFGLRTGPLLVLRLAMALDFSRQSFGILLLGRRCLVLKQQGKERMIGEKKKQVQSDRVLCTSSRVFADEIQELSHCKFFWKSMATAVVRSRHRADSAEKLLRRVSKKRVTWGPGVSLTGI